MDSKNQIQRTIKFRAWDIEFKKMYPDSESKDILMRQSLFDCKKGGGCDYSKKIELMQYTGLKDKNGKEIYEGDILKIKWEKYSTGGYMQSSDSYIEYEEISKVEWMSVGWGFKKMDGKYFSLPKNSNLEVIGNIYETPQLLNND